MEIRIIIDDRIVTALRKMRSLATRRRVTTVAALTVFGTGLAAVAAPAVKPHTFTAGTPIVAADVNENFDTIYDALNAHVIREDQTVSIAAADGCGALVTALDDLEDVRIAESAMVTIELGAGVYTCAATLDVAHPNGNRLEIVGTGATPDAVTLQFSADTTGVQVLSARLARLTNLTVAGGDGSQGTGISAEQDAYVALIDVVVRDFAFGIGAGHGSSLSGTNVQANSNTFDGIQALRASLIVINGAVADDNGRDGFVASMSSSMTLIGTVRAQGNGQSGFVAMRGAVIEATAPTSTENNNGVFAAGGGIVFAENPTLTNNADHGTFAITGGQVEYVGTVTANGNTTADTNITPNGVNTSDGAIILQ